VVIREKSSGNAESGGKVYIYNIHHIIIYLYVKRSGEGNEYIGDEKGP